MAMTSSVRPSVGRIIGSAGPQHATSPSPLLAIFSTVTGTATIQRCPFSSTQNLSERRPRRDNNRLRGLSSIYRSGPRFRTNLKKDEVPEPAADYNPEVVTDPQHGLWDFFYAKEKLLTTPDEVAEHGRGWTVEELRHKSWDDLHRLWWVCVKEQNRLATLWKEHTRLKLRNGSEQMEARMQEIRKTMKSIRHTLTERYYVWEDARKLAETDPEVDLGNPENPYVPSSYMDENTRSAESLSEPAAEPVVEQAGEQQEQEGSEKSAAEKVDPSTLPADTTEPQQPQTRV